MYLLNESIQLPINNVNILHYIVNILVPNYKIFIS